MAKLLSMLISLFVGLAEICLALRVIFRLFNANNVHFVEWVYNTSNQLLEPFRGIFNTGHVANGHVLDFTALFGIVVYALVGYVLAKVLKSLRHEKHQKSSKKG